MSPTQADSARQAVRLNLLLVILALVLAPCGHAVADEPRNERVEVVPPEGDGIKYWPHWRGPKMDGHAQPGDYPERWSPTENVLWKVEVPGAGNSSPIIWADRIFLTTSYDVGKRRSILCLDRKDGQSIWEAFVPEGIKEKVIKDKNGYASGSAVTDGERVYAYFGNYGLFCVNWDGKKVWHQTFGDMDAYHGMACTPLLYRDRLEGDTYVLTAGPTFKLLHINRLGEKTLASPAMLDGRWYIRTVRHLYCIGRKG